MKQKQYARDPGLSARMALTTFLLGALYVAFFFVLLQLFSLSIGAVVAIIAALALVQYFASDRIALRASGARVVSPEQAPELHAMVERLCLEADLPKPRVAVIPTDVPNAFATGRNPKNAVVAVTQGLWNRLNAREIEGVLAHELAHIANRDVLIMTVASFFAMVAAMLMRFGLFAGLMGGGRSRNAGGGLAIILLVSLVTYVISFILIRAISRYREYVADRSAAVMTGRPEHLMSALEKIAGRMSRIPESQLREVERMNAFFIVPTTLRRAAGELFLTHPPLEKRLAALAEVAEQMGRPVRRRR